MLYIKGINKKALFLNYFRLAVRTSVKYRSMTFIGSFSLIVGITGFILLMLYVQYELGYDSFFEKSDRIFLIGQSLMDQESGGSSSYTVTSGLIAPTLKKEFEAVRYAVRVKEVESPLTYMKKSIVAHGLYADRDFLKVFTFRVTEGDRETALTDPFSVVLSETLAKKLFGDDDPMGKTITYENERVLRVTGIIKDTPGNTHLKFDYLISFLTMYSLRDDIDRSWMILNYYSYIQLADGIPAGEFENKLSAIVDKYHDTNSKNRRYFLVPLRKIHFATDITNSSIAATDRKNIFMLISIAFSILAIACINHINITTARADARAKEVAIRKINGASRQLLVKQFMIESYVLTFFSIILSMVAVVLLLPVYSKIVGNNISLHFILDFRNLIWFLGLFLAVGLFAGGYPAFYLSSLRSLDILKSSFGSPSYKGHWKFRNILTVFQFGVSVILMMVAVTIQKQLIFIKSKNIGYNRENVLAIRMWNDKGRKNPLEIKRELLKNPLISASAVANTLPLFMTERNNIFIETEKGEMVELPLVTTYFIDEDYLGLFNMQITSGRNFSRDFSYNIENQVIINETAADLAGLTDPVGKKIDKWGQELEIIGVVKDFHFTSLKRKIEPLLFSYGPELNNVFLIRISDRKIWQTLQYIDSTFRRFDSNFTFDFSFMDDEYNNLYKNESNLGKIILSFSILTMIIAVIGMYGLISFVVRRKTKEIAVRKVMGGSVSSVMGEILKYFFLPITIAILVSLPVAYYIAHDWLKDFAYHINLSAGLIAFSVTIIVIIAFLSIVLQTIKAAVANPAESLRLE